MKKVASISFIALSTLVLMVLAIVPHHHHEGTACIVMERCEQDDAVNDEHTNHCETPINSNQNSTCIAEADLIAPQHNNQAKYKENSCNSDYKQIHLFPIYFFVADILTCKPDHVLSGLQYKEYISLYKSAEASQFHGLRAPPYFIS